MVGQRGVFIGLGSNLGDRAGHIAGALRDLVEADDIRVVACSTVHETDPVGGPAGQPKFLNAVAELETGLTPRELLVRLLDIEHRHGRVRETQNGPRTLDLDILLFRALVIDEADLHVPHPRMWRRTFVLEPLAEICDVARLRPLR